MEVGSELEVLWAILNGIKERTLSEAAKSPCVRRKYGATLFSPITPYYAISNHNKRVTNACSDGCLRDISGLDHGKNCDIGAEIHAEQALLIAKRDDIHWSLMIAGFDRDGNALQGRQNWPCYTCARMVKEAALGAVWSPTGENYEVHSIETILDTYEQEFLSGLGDS